MQALAHGAWRCAAHAARPDASGMRPARCTAARLRQRDVARGSSGTRTRARTRGDVQQRVAEAEQRALQTGRHVGG